MLIIEKMKSNDVQIRKLRKIFVHIYLALVPASKPIIVIIPLIVYTSFVKVKCLFT